MKYRNVFMNKRGDSASPFPVVGGWILVLIVVIILLMILAMSFGYIDLGFLRGVRLGGG